TEGQQRRERMADCEFECSEIYSYLFVGGYYVAGNRALLLEMGITHIVNCSASVVENAFSEDPTLRYLSLSMVDGRQDDICWFLPEVVQFIMRARSVNGKILIHCEKGISRSCSYAIAYRIWATGDSWKTCFNFVKKRRKVCAPNTAFTCNLIELGELIGSGGDSAMANLLFRCAYHLPHDPTTATLKLCRTAETRKIITPSTSMLDPLGVFVLRMVPTHEGG
ncbi:protein-tyrosine phosphatase-like protein, partial [Ochromonadaceae sp. CCMP2298]